VIGSVGAFHRNYWSFCHVRPFKVAHDQAQEGCRRRQARQGLHADHQGTDGRRKRAIQRGTGELPGVSYDEITYEGYGPGGAAIIIETLTDNKNRTVGELRHMLGKYGGNLAAENSVAWMFDKKGYIVVDKAKAEEEALMAAALDAGADDMRDDGEAWEIMTPIDAFQKVLEAVKAMGIEPGAAEIAMLPQNYVKLEGKTAQQMIKLMEAAEDHEDTKKVWSNADIEEKEIEASLA
jgi:YebC/PmpR family DNA-binding regulatory protein